MTSSYRSTNLFICKSASDNTITYTVGTCTLKLCATANDLSIAIQSSLKPGKHCKQIAAKANARAKLILKAFLSHNAQSLPCAFTTFVRPILEYVTPVWCPYFKTDINIIENAQHSITRTQLYRYNFTPTNYDKRLKRFGSQCLELSRIIPGLYFMFKLTHGLTDCNLHHAIHYAPKVGTRGHRYKLYLAHARKLILSIPTLNFLPDQCFSPDTYNAFRTKICKIDFSRFLMCEF